MIGEQRMRKHGAALAALGVAFGWLLCFDGPAALAQTAAPEARPQQETEAAAAAARAAAEARDSQVLQGPAVSFADVLKDPDNIDLNFRFARQKVAEGDLRGAASTLERILLVQPNLGQIRLLYAIVLFRLDNAQEAEREFRTVLEQPVSPDVKAEVERYLQQIALRNRTTRFNASLGVGMDFNTNRDAAPRFKQRLFADIPLNARGGRNDIGTLALASIGLRHDLGYQDRHELLASTSLYYANQNEVDNQDLRAFSAEAGAALRLAAFDLTPTVTWQRVQLANEPFLDSKGLKLLAEKKLDGKTDIYGSFWAQTQDYQRANVSPTAPNRNGPRYDFDFGFNYILNPTMKLGLNFNHTEKYARTNFDSYAGNEVTGSHTWLLGRGQFLLSSLAIGRDIYVEADPFVSSLTRRDTNVRARATYGTPLENVAELAGYKLPEYVADLTLTGTLEGFWANSTVQNFTYRNYKLQTLLTKRFDF